MSKQRRHKKMSSTHWILTLSVVLVVLAMLAVDLHFLDQEPELKFPTENITLPDDPEDATTGPTDPTTEPTTEPSTEPTTEPPVTKVSTATVSATGDILMHLPCINGGKNSDGTYSFDHYFKYFGDYIKKADYAVANLETTLAGLDNGYKYSGYPSFNCPDGIVTTLQNSGFDLLLTANNHCYDTGTKGYHRTQQVLTDANFDYIGSVPNEDAPQYLVKEINGIRIGMVCYTYEDNSDPNVVAPNGINMKDADEKLINSFNINDLDSFYQRIEGQIKDMKQEGAEALVLYIHWGVEYQLKENKTQNNIAQKMCDLGIDVIVGGHPHVIQPMELLTSSSDESHKTLCLYSTGNALSNQRRQAMRLDTGHTEDGILFSFTFAKYSDGTVRVEDADVLPTWVNKYHSSATGKDVYEIYPLDVQIEDWKTQMDMRDATEKSARESYDRTMKIVGEGLEEINAYLDSLPPIA